MNDELRRPAGLAVVLDATAVLAAGWLAWLWRFGRLAMPEHYLVGLVLGVLLVLALLPALGAYRGRGWPGPGTGVTRAAPGLLAALTVLVLLAAATKTTADFSRLWTAAWLLLSLVLMATWRLTLQRWRAWRGAQRQSHILILGTGDLASETARRLLERNDSKDNAIGAWNDDRNRVAGFLAIGDESPADLPAPILGGLASLEQVLSETRPPITEIWLAAGDIDAVLRERVVAELQLASLPVCYVPDLTLLNLIGHRPRRVAGLNVIELNATPLDGPDAAIKSALDRALAALMLLALAPLLLTVTLLVRLESGRPVLFRQQRHGGDGRVFDVLKFRTMRDSDTPAHRQATRDDPRVTRIGRFLRRTSIDELPQLINVLRGEMSLVGPRPHPVALNHEYAGKIHAFMQRHRVRPGITGWAQVNGYRGETDTLEKMRKRFEHDLYYIENWSLGLDFRILLLTLFRIWDDENAY